MLTPQEISDKVFVKAVFGGYDMTGVDDFLESISADYSALYKENAILKGKLKVLVEKVEEYRSTEDSMRMALLTAQKMGEEITVEATKKKDEILKNADDEAKSRLSQISQRVSDEEAKLAIASKETAKFIALSQAIMQKHSEFLAKLETARRAVVPEVRQEAPASVQAAPPAPAPEINSEGTFAADAPTQVLDRAVSPVDEIADTVSEIINDDTQQGDFDELGKTAASVTPRPRFDFDDLKFGANFENKD